MKVSHRLTLPRLLLGFFATAVAAAALAAPPTGPDERREADWRNGAIVDQMLVDRFVPAANLDAKRLHYPPPKVLRDWQESAKPGVDLADAKLNSRELDFSGGDLQGRSTRLDHIQQPGADVLYLNPVHLADTNHKHDAFDFKAIFKAVSPEDGSRADLKRLAADVHQRGMKLVLDGVFKHMGRNAPKFQDALNNPRSRWRDWFATGPQYAGGARVWTGFQNLPELNLENPEVRAYLHGSPDSVVRSDLPDGVDGWRLDTAFEPGHRYLRTLADAAHQQKPGALVVGEIVNGPGAWLQAMDGVMNFALRQIVPGVAQRELPAARSARLFRQRLGAVHIFRMF